MVSRCLALITLLCPLILLTSAQDTLLDPPECGVSAAKGVYGSRIVGGVPAKRDAWPWMAALGYKNPDGSAKPVFKCGGTLISKKHVLTSAYCVADIPDLIVVRFSILSLTNDKPVDMEIEEKQVHPEYNKKTIANDIAVLTLKREVILSDALRPICLPHSEPLASDDFNGKFSYVAGWGATSFEGAKSDLLMQSFIPIVTNKQCREAYSGFPDLAINNRTICAGRTAGGNNACEGDNGGPLMLIYDGTVYEVGLYSYSHKCAERGYPGIYTRITEHMNFIKTAMHL